MILNRLRRLLKRCAPSRRPGRAQRRPARLALEALEDRLTPSHTLQVDTNLADHNYHSIQAAINDAQPGDQIRIAAGTYQEQLTINKSIKLIGTDHSTIVLAPTNLGTPTATNPGAIVHVTGTGTSVQITHLTIQGAAAGTPNLLYGVRVDGNAIADIENDTITNIIDSSSAQFGVAIDVGNTAASDGTSDQVGSAKIANNTITNYQRAGIVINHAGSVATVTNNTVAGGSASTADSVTGIEVSDGAVADIENNTVTGNTNGSNGTGVLLASPGAAASSDSDGDGDDDDDDFGGPVVRNNKISGNDYGIFGSSVTATSGSPLTSADIENNHITGNTYVGIEFDNSANAVIANNQLSGNGSQNTADGGIYLFQSTNNLLANNQSKNNNGSGIYLDSGSTGNVLIHNHTTGNVYSTSDGNADAVDLSTGHGTAGTANTWIDDEGKTFIDNSGASLFEQLDHDYQLHHHHHRPHWWR
jgi:parallel beta-helix repeat protein